MTSGVNLNTQIDYRKLMENPYYQQRMANGYGATTGTTQPSFGATETDTYTSTINTTNGCTDGKDDGKIGFWSAVGNTVKGVGKTLVNGVKGMFTNKDGKFSLGKTLASVGTAALCIAFPAVGLAACAVGGVMGAVQVGKGIYNVATADTDAEAKQAWQNIGGGTFTVVTSYFGGKASLGAVRSSSTAGLSGLDDAAAAVAKAQGKTSAYSQLDKTATITQKAGALMKDMGSSTVNRGRTIGQTASAFVKQGKLTKANKKVEGLEKKIADAADDADTTKLQKKLESAKEAKAKAQEAYDTSNGKTNVEKIEVKLNEKKTLKEYHKEVKKARKAEKNGTDSTEAWKVADEMKSKNTELIENKYWNNNGKGAKAIKKAENAKIKAEQKANGETIPNKTINSIKHPIETIKNMSSFAFSGLSKGASAAYKFLVSPEGNYAKAVQQFGYDAVYEVLAVVESYSLAEQSV